MKTAQFPAVLEARKVVVNQMTFYQSMMSSDEPAKTKGASPKKSALRKNAAPARMKQAKEVCSA